MFSNLLYVLSRDALKVLKQFTMVCALFSHVLYTIFIALGIEILHDPCSLTFFILLLCDTWF